MRPDAAATDALGDSLARLLPDLDAFTRFEGPDPAARRTLWRAALDEPLPETGAGREAVLETLRTVVVANGLRIGAPGFSGWVTTMPTTLPIVALRLVAIDADRRPDLRALEHALDEDLAAGRTPVAVVASADDARGRGRDDGRSARGGAGAGRDPGVTDHFSASRAFFTSASSRSFSGPAFG